jgi:hypothetical protein
MRTRDRIGLTPCVAAFPLLLAGVPVLANGVITVCLEGTPTCDYVTIQEGVDAAGGSGISFEHVLGACHRARCAPVGTLLIAETGSDLGWPAGG